VEIFACGPEPMLLAAAQLARDYSLPCQVSLEEFMACAVGGCAGCTVRVNTPSGPAMKRVCVDGPVFDAAMVDWG
jgi:dihydroorotate dehydrogenase electron transfer subunit